MKPLRGVAGGGSGVATVALSLVSGTIAGVSSLLASMTSSSGFSSNVGVTGGGTGEESGVELLKATNPVSTFSDS